MPETGPETSRRPGAAALRAAILFLALVSAIGLLRAATTLSLHVPFDNNEGWIASYAADAISGGALYPAADSFRFNNYPPLFFYLSGGLGLLVHDNILAGRMLSLIGFLLTSLGIVMVSGALGMKKPSGLFGALFFMAVIAFDTDRLGMNDPQLIGHALSMAGLWLALRGRRGVGTMLGAALFLTLALFTKHSLIVQPLTLFLWLALVDRPAAVLLAGWGLALAGLGAAGFQTLYHRSLWSQLASPRLFSWAASAKGTAGWLEVCGLPLAASLGAFLAAPRNRATLFFFLYLMVSLTVGAWFEGGSGTDSNVLFDNLIALALCAAAGFEYLSQKPRKGWLANAYVACFVLPVAVLLAMLAAEDDFHPRYWLDRQNEIVRAASTDIALIRAQPEPVLCSDLALCYWAGKQAQLDVWGMQQAILTHNRGSGELAAAIAERRYAMLAVDFSAYSYLWPAPVQGAIRENYRLIRTDSFATFWVRR